ncbi:aldo-keto reductase AKR2E4-like [Galleria mellonella]|uniref:Aldo-keto reductase AKR2E4-like n=1 Tax=Galleria mellonella TaxID=7137 RepID=A0ABM3N0E5_GALME|nr:aldo-keto reductase AKR2E4-like [Galleria mellonella]
MRTYSITRRSYKMFLFWLTLTILFRNALCDEKDGGVAPRVLLNDGNTIPSLGLGTFLGFDENGQKAVKDGEVERPVTWALQSGYRMLDTAAAYLNEEQIGNAIRKSSIPRENIFVVTKLASNKQRDVVSAIKESLSRLNLTYVDLYLIHNPVAFKPDHSGFDVIDYLDTWKGMEETQRLGLTKSIGLSNFNISQIERVLANCVIKPSVLQVEVNLNLAQNKLIDFCKAHNIAVMAYTPFGALFDAGDVPPPPRVNDPILIKMADRYNKTTPQIVLRYLVQRGVIPIPKSVNKERIEQNIDVFDFALTAEDMETLGKFNKDYRTVHPSFWQEHPYYPFEKVDKPAPDLFKPKN